VAFFSAGEFYDPRPIEVIEAERFKHDIEQRKKHIRLAEMRDLRAERAAFLKSRDEKRGWSVPRCGECNEEYFATYSDSGEIEIGCACHPYTPELVPHKMERLPNYIEARNKSIYVELDRLCDESLENPEVFTVNRELNIK